MRNEKAQSITTVFFKPYLLLSTINMRFEVLYKDHSLDGRAHRVLNRLKTSEINNLRDLAIVDVYLIDGVPGMSSVIAADLLSDPVAQRCFSESAADEALDNWNYLIEIGYRPGVTDPVAITTRDALEDAFGKKAISSCIVQTARQYLFGTDGTTDIDSIKRQLHNPLIQKVEVITREQWKSGKRLPSIYPHRIAPSPSQIEIFAIRAMTDENLLELSLTRLLALTIEELQSIKRYYRDQAVRNKRLSIGIAEDATDVELEMIAQTWSEHCKHKILNATIYYSDDVKQETIKSLFSTYIKSTTNALMKKKDYLRSVFHDDSGVIQFDEDTLVCFKVETHNSPSALDPYGGAITGIVGVNRDILGTGKSAKPIFNTDVLCFGPPDTPQDDIPSGLLHPKQVLSGVHHGIVDGGNQSGIPVVAGAFLFDDSYIGKPLVFCGTGGILPAEIEGEGSWIKHIDPGDKAVMVGGRIGKDGIHGATFSSLALDETSPTSAVQIGDPITQKKMSDFLLEARDLRLFKGITDNGAGGLSSSLGEMAEFSHGIQIDLDACPLKYEGLAPWEILVSESQERMSLAVDPLKLPDFLDLAERRDVEATVVGEFTDSGYVEIFYHEKPVGYLSLSFLHHGLPEMRLNARWAAPPRSGGQIPEKQDCSEILLKLLRDPNIASKESLVRQYDHEVQAQSVIKPFTGVYADAPSDGAVFRPKIDSRRGITITHGICPRYGDIDTYDMALCAVDEAYRAHIALGGDPGLVSALDNFCWPDPIESDTTPDGAYKLAQLVRACRGLSDGCRFYGIPLISGKDSMKNDAHIEGKKVSVRPTLLISLMGIIRDIGDSVNTDFINPGDSIVIIGRTHGELGGTSYEKHTAEQFEKCPHVDLKRAKSIYKKLSNCISNKLVSSCHDISDGGIAVALAESCLGGRLGASIELSKISGYAPEMETARALFCETPSRFIATVKHENLDTFLREMAAGDAAVIGAVDSGSDLAITRNGITVLKTNLHDIEKAWKSTFQS